MLKRPSILADTTIQAILLIILTVTMFSCADVMAKYLRESMPAIEIAWIRYALFVALALLLAGRGRFRGLRAARPGLQLLRGVTLVGSAVLFTLGLGWLPVAEASSISFVSPALITALSIPLLGEKVGIRRWMAVLAGFVGVLIVVQPGSAAFQAAAVFPFLSATAWAFTVVITRMIGGAERPVVTMLWSACTGFLLLTALLPFNFVPLSWTQIALCLLHGLFASAGQLLMILAYRLAPASVLAPFSYCQLLTSALLGFAAFGTVPGQPMLVGASVIIASGLYMAHRERIRAQQEQR